MNKIDQLVDRLDDPIAFAEEYCDYHFDDYHLYSLDVIWAGNRGDRGVGY